MLLPIAPPVLSWIDDLIYEASQNIIKDEGTVRNREGQHIAYRCPADKLTIAYGRNIDSEGGLGLSENEAQYLLKNDVRRVFYECVDTVWNFSGLSKVRQTVLLNMCFQLGLTRFRTFKKMLAALRADDFKTAAEEMLDSKAAKQTPERYKRFSDVMRMGR